MEELNVKFRGNNVIDQQSKGHSDAIALMFTMKSGGVNSKQDGLNPKVNLIGESADATLTVNTDMSTNTPNYSTAVESHGGALTIGGQGTINLNPGYSGDKGFAGAMGISANTFTITDNVKVNIKTQIANPETTSTKFGVLGTYGSAVLAGNSQLDIELMGVTGGNAIGMYSRENITVTEQASLKVKADSPNMSPVGVRADKDTVFSSAKDADIQAPGGRVWYAGKVAAFEGPGDVNGTGASKFSLQAAGNVTMAKGYGVFAPESGKVNNPGVVDADGQRVSEWQLSILKPLYELVKTSPAKAVESPMKGKEYAKQGIRHEYSAPETVTVKGKTWRVKINASNGQLTVTPAADAVRGDRADIPVTVTYYDDDAVTEGQAGSNVAKMRKAIAPVVISEATATPQLPTVQDMKDVTEGSWQKEIIPSYGPDEAGNPNPFDGAFKYDVTYVNNDGELFNPDDPVSRGKKAVVTVSLTDKGKESYTSLKCPEGATCEVNGDGNVVFTVDLAFKPKPESPDKMKLPDETKESSATSKAQHGHGGLPKTGSADMTLLGASALLLLAGGYLLKRRHM
ncbi:Rib/alpha-like domain-containing protein [Alloscardovia sp. HMSC034E08]|uniref:Rib/alpha-like domain-containing protein n=1 Tax=Alloscardovia sp. HMSC034E08 TaxID=1739413 RepID=UPI0008F971AE|nr:Rib/alpha-like domain-containing protein [Alloscardovia sp. HMSC034E08]